MNTNRAKWAFIHPFQLRLRRGIESYIWNLSTHLISNGLSIDILTWQGILEIPERFCNDHLCLKTAPDVRYFQSQVGIPNYCFNLLKRNYKHVFINFAGYGEGIALSLINILKPVQFSIVFHFPRSMVPYRYAEYERWGLQNKAKHLIAVSNFVAKEVEQWADRPCDVIGHGVDTQRFSPNHEKRIEIREKYNIPENAKVLISVAALEERKGIQFGLQAMSVIRQQFPDTYYIILGEGDFRAPLEFIIADRHLESNTFLLGSVSDVSAFMCASDFFLLLSKGEASPVSLLEAMANGLAIITSKHPPFDELVNEEWGVMVDEESDEEVVSAICWLFQNHEIAQRMGAAARLSAIQKYSWDQIAKKYRNLVG